MYAFKFEHPTWPTRLNVSESFHEYDGELVVFIHGLGANADRWAANMEACAPLGVPSVALDLPGHGFAVRDSSRLESPQVLVEALDAVVKGLAVRRLHLVGTSLGGRVAGEYAVDHADRVVSLALVGASGFPDRARTVPAVISRAKDTSRFGIRQKLLNLVFRPELVSEAWVENDYRHNCGPDASASLSCIADWFAGSLAGPMPCETLEALREMKPLLIWGRHDRSIPIATGYTASSILGSRLFICEHSAHAPYHEEPDIFNSYLRHFVAERQIE